MDSFRGLFGDRTDTAEEPRPFELGDDEGVIEPPPLAIGQDERRMQVRAYNHWASLLDDKSFPSIEDLEPDKLPDFGPYSVLLDFSVGTENPAVQYLGAKLGAECGATGPIKRLTDVPGRSLLSRITDHYMQILANQAPIGFEAEFVNQAGETILYRGILLPFSSDDDTIDFIYGVINWKELADQRTTDELMLEIDQALDEPARRRDDPLTVWADGPVANDDQVLDLAGLMPDEPAGTVAWPQPGFGGGTAAVTPMRFPEPRSDEPPEAPLPPSAHPELSRGAAEPVAMGLADWLASARELAQAARNSEDRTRGALYAAIGRAYDFALAAWASPEEFAELIAELRLTMQDRAPMTPVVKLVFGADYDKTRLTEYASALSHAQRHGLGRGALADYLATAPGGLKGVVQAERQLKREEAGRAALPREAPRERLARRLRKLAPRSFAELAPEGAEFALLVARRLPSGEVTLLGEVPEDAALIERAARRLLA